MDNNSQNHRQPYDVLGIIVSTICGIHCLVTPLAILYLPRIGPHFESPWVHIALIGLVIFAFYHSIYSHYKVHKSKAVIITGTIGLAILIVTSSIEAFSLFHGHEHHHGHEEHHHEEGLMTYITILGAILLIKSHILNIRKCRCLTTNETC